MKKGLVIFSLILIISISFVSAGFWGDFWNSITGKAVEDIPSGYLMYKGFDNENTNSLDGFGKAASFNGNGQLKNIGNFDSSVSGNAVNGFSTCFWFNWQGNSQSTVDSRRQNMFDHSAWPSKGFFIELNENPDLTGGQTGILIYLLPGYDGIRWLPFGLPQKNTWHHLCLTYDSGVYNAYLDGVKSDNPQQATYYYPSSSNIYLGGAGGRWFNGLIDEVYVYPYALSDSQVKDLVGVGEESQEPAPTCIPKTCSELGKQCGSVDDGCGKTLNCGSCSQGSECDSIGLCRVIGTPSPCGVCKTGEICNEKTGSCMPAKFEVSYCPGYSSLLEDGGKEDLSDSIEDSSKIDSNEIQRLTREILLEEDNFISRFGNLFRVGSFATTSTIKARERKNIMLNLAEKDPSAFLIYSVPNSKQRTLSKSVLNFMEKETIGLKGTLEVIENPHKGLSEEELQEAEGGFDYFLNTNEGRFNLKFADNSQPLVSSGIQVKVNGVSLDNYLVTSSARTRAFTILENVEKVEINHGIQKIAIILTKAPGAPPVGDVGTLEEEMRKADEYFREVSKGQVSLEWDVFGWYDTDDFDVYSVVREIIDPNLEFFGEYNRVITIDQRSFCGACAGVGAYDVDFNHDGIIDGHQSFVYLSGIWYWTTIAHELGHNFGAWHANKYECGDSYLDSLNRCFSIEYGDAFDIMGGSSGQGHLNAPHKETVTWLDNENIQTVTENGIYIIDNFESGGGITTLKIPKKKDEFGNGADFYYLEYRTPRGFDSEIISGTQTVNGPQIRFTGYIPGSGGGGDTHLIDMTSEAYPENVGISQGETFVDPFINLKIKTLEVNENSATVEVTLSDHECVRRIPTFEITPLSITGQKTDYFIYNVELVNNDNRICADREIYSSLSQESWHYFVSTSFGNMIGSEDYPTLLSAGQKISGSLFLSFDNIQSGVKNFDILIFEVDRGLFAEDMVTMNIVDELEIPFWPGEDVARRIIYSGKATSYIILDKYGGVHRVGNGFYSTTGNGPYWSNEEREAVAIVQNIREESFILLDSYGEIYDVGLRGKEIFFTPSEVLPKFRCDLAKDVGVEAPGYDFGSLYLLDAYGDVYLTHYGGTITNWFQCQNWEGRKDVSRPGEDHAKNIELEYDENGYRTSYYVLSKDGTIYHCDYGNYDLDFTRLNEPFTMEGDRYMVAMDFDPERGMVVLDSYGKVYTTGSVEHLGNIDFGYDIARDISFIPNSNGYAVLTGDGAVHEFN